MKIYGKRVDGSLLVSLGAGLGVIMRGDHATKALDLETLVKMGPWAPADNSLAARRDVQKRLDRCKTIALAQFHLGVTYSEKMRLATDALRLKLGLGAGSGYPLMSGSDMYVKDMDEENVYYCVGGKDFRQPYSYSDGQFTWNGDPVETEMQQVDKLRG